MRLRLDFSYGEILSPSSSTRSSARRRVTPFPGMQLLIKSQDQQRRRRRSSPPQSHGPRASRFICLHGVERHCSSEDEMSNACRCRRVMLAEEGKRGAVESRGKCGAVAAGDGGHRACTTECPTPIGRSEDGVREGRDGSGVHRALIEPRSRRSSSSFPARASQARRGS